MGTNNLAVSHHLARLDNGVTLHCLRTGVEGAEPLVLLHGWPQHSHMWRKVLPTLAERFQVIIPDLRGAGGSTITPGGYDKRSMAEDVRGLLDDLGLAERPVCLAGYDHGAGVAYAFASAHPDRVRRLAIMEYAMAGFGYEHELQPSPQWNVYSNWQLAFFTLPDVAERFLVGRERELLAWFFTHAACNPEAVGHEDFELYVRQLQKPGALRAGISYYAAVWTDAEHNRENARRGKLAMPVLAIGGEASGGAVIAQALEPLAQRIQGEVLPGAGHWPADEQPEALGKLLLDFFQARDA